MSKSVEYTRTSDKPNRFKKRFDKPKEKPKMDAHRYAMWLLSRYEYSAEKLRTKMIHRGYSGEEAAAGLAVVQERGYQSDERFAESKARARQHRAGDRKIELVLRSKGISQDVALDQISTLEPEEDRAVRAGEKYRGLIGEDGLTADLRKDIYAKLARKGFSAKSVKAALTALQHPPFA
jgi:regulatory protein